MFYGLSDIKLLNPIIKELRDIIVGEKINDINI